MNRWLAALVALLVLGAAGVAGATSYIKLSPAEVLKEARIVVIGRVSGALPAWEEGEHGIYNGMVLDVEAYVAGQPGPAQLQVRLFGGQVCNWMNQCRAIAGGMEGKELVGRRMLVALKPSQNGLHLDPVGGPNGLVRLAENGLAVMDPTQGEADVKAWEAFLTGAEQVQPEPGTPRTKLETPRPAQPAPGSAPPRTSLLVAAIGGVALLALGAVGASWWRRRMG